MHSSSSFTAEILVILGPGPRCSEAVRFSTLTTKLFFLSLLGCSPPSFCSQAWRRQTTLATEAWDPPVTSLSSIMLCPPCRAPSYAPCECWARTADEEWRLPIACIGSYFPLHTPLAALTRLLSSSVSVLLLSLDWRKDDPKSYFWELSPIRNGAQTKRNMVFIFIF